MDTQTHEHQQKEFLSSFFPSDISVEDIQRSLDSHHSHGLFSFNNGPTVTHPGVSNSQPGLGNGANTQLNMDLLGNLMAMQGIESPTVSAHPQTQYTPQLLLEQQFKLTQLQQLQQLQNQIFQQQIALISGQAGGNASEPPSEPQREQPPPRFHGLPTPGSSTELRAQPNTDYVSPMILHYMDTPQEQYRDSSMDNLSPATPHSVNTHYMPPRGSTSAPAHIAFNTSPSLSQPSPAELDFDISPLTSPWLGAHQQNPNKRTASPSGDESAMKPSRKKLSPAIRPQNPTSSTKKIMRGSRSTNSTPLLRSSRSRRGSMAGDGIGDTPSPVDLSMPPPAPPSNQIPSSTSASSAPLSSSNFGPQLTPVTPASIMNLGRLGIHTNLGRHTLQPPKVDPKAKAPTRPKTNIESAARGKPAVKGAGGSLVSPSLKAILPAGNTPNVNITPSVPPGQPVQAVRKTSHKAAEQKRRDSLKTTFDDLRLLLPPIPLPSDDNFPDEPILPGALPPRGPPKAGGEGPNKGVSKLQLLRCGNDLIRQLKGRVERRDEEIEKLRQEVARLRTLVEDDALKYGMDGLDLERDIDAGEASGATLGRGGSIIEDYEADEGDE